MHHVFNSTKQWIKQHVGVAIAGTILAVAALFGRGAVEFSQDAYATVRHMVPEIEAKLAKLEASSQESNEKILQSLGRVEQAIRRGLLTHEGRATRRDCCEGDRDYWVAINSNQHSAVSRYPQGTILKITRRDPPVFSFEARVDGQFAADNPQYLIQVNRRGWDRLRTAGDSSEIWVFVEEVEK